MEDERREGAVVTVGTVGDEEVEVPVEEGPERLDGADDSGDGAAHARGGPEELAPGLVGDAIEEARDDLLDAAVNAPVASVIPLVVDLDEPLARSVPAGPRWPTAHRVALLTPARAAP